MTGISVLVVNWNSSADLARCLASLEAQHDRDFEVVVVDNGSSDDSCHIVKRDFPSVKLIEAGENLGFAEGCNRGIEACTRSWVATLNNDAVASPDWISKLRATIMSCAESVGMIQSRILFDQPPHDTNSTGVAMYSDGTFIDRDFRKPAVEGEVTAPVFCVSAGAGVYRRAMLDAVKLGTGVFDRTFFMYYEDVDLGWRCRLAGWDALYAPSAVVYHRLHGSSKRRGRHFVSLHSHRNRVRTLLKNGSLWRLVRGAPLTVLQLAQSLYHAGPGELAPFLRAFVDGVRQRRAVERLGRVPRITVERRWITRK